jgi:hypothetical protein
MRRNRELVHDHAAFFRALLPGSGEEWLTALGSPKVRMPDAPALLWVTVKGDRLYAAEP